MSQRPSQNSHHPFPSFPPASPTFWLEQEQLLPFMEQLPGPPTADGSSWYDHTLASALPTIAGQGMDPYMANDPSQIPWLGAPGTQHGHLDNSMFLPGQSVETGPWHTSTLTDNPASQSTWPGLPPTDFIPGLSPQAASSGPFFTEGQSMQTGPSGSQPRRGSASQGRPANHPVATIPQRRKRPAEQRDLVREEPKRRRGVDLAAGLNKYGSWILRTFQGAQETFVLQMTPPRGDQWAVCAAVDHCMGKACWKKGKQPSDFGHHDITDPYRIMLDNGQEREHRVYFHVLCFQHMVDAPSLIPGRFNREGMSAPWGIMIDEWFRHRGRISLDKIAAYIEAEKVYQENSRQMAAEWLDWDPVWCCVHLEVNCGCETSTLPMKPVLEGHITGPGETCSLYDVVSHPLCGERVEPGEFGGVHGDGEAMSTGGGGDGHAMTGDQVAVGNGGADGV